MKSALAFVFSCLRGPGTDSGPRYNVIISPQAILTEPQYNQSSDHIGGLNAHTTGPGAPCARRGIRACLYRRAAASRRRSNARQRITEPAFRPGILATVLGSLRAGWELPIG